jgi:lysophospholipid acyltransferase (LPLAT)-like uncharacterized protein
MLFKKNDKVRDAKWQWIGLIGKLFIDFLFVGSRLEIRGYPMVASLIESRQCIFAFWHSRILLPSYHHKGLNASILVSNSADGEIIAQIIKRQGQWPVRGSTGKGGVRALTQQIHDIRLNKRPGAVVPDGPQGPRHQVQPGVILLAKKTQYPIIPISYGSKWRFVFNSWDRFILPLPASPAMLIYGRPIAVPGSSGQDQLKIYAKELEKELNRITHEADHSYGHPNSI